MYYLVRKEIHGKFENKKFAEKRVRKHRCSKKEINGKYKRSSKIKYIHNDFMEKIIKNCNVATPKAIELKSQLGLNQNDATLTKEQSVIIPIMNTFERENMQTQFGILGYRTNLHFHDHKLAVEVDEEGHKNRNIDHRIKRPK